MVLRAARASLCKRLNVVWGREERREQIHRAASLPEFSLATNQPDIRVAGGEFCGVCLQANLLFVKKKRRRRRNCLPLVQRKFLPKMNKF